MSKEKTTGIVHCRIKAINGEGEETYEMEPTEVQGTVKEFEEALAYLNQKELDFVKIGSGIFKREAVYVVSWELLEEEA